MTSGGAYAADLGSGITDWRPGKNADLNSLDALAGGPVFKLPSETPDDYQFCIGTAGWGLRCMGVLPKAIPYKSETGKVQTKGVCYARVKAAATAKPGAFLIPEGGSAHHFVVSASPSPFRLITDLSGQTVGTVYGPETPTSANTIPQIVILENPDNGRITWSGPATLDRDGIALAQTPAGAGDLTLNGAFVTGGVATLTPPRCVGIYGAGAENGKTFTVYGTNILGEAISESIAGPNNSTVFTSLAYATVTRVAVDQATAGDVEVGDGDKLGLPDAAAARLVETCFFNGAVEGTLPTVAKDADEIEKNTADPNSALNGSQVDLLLYER